MIYEYRVYEAAMGKLPELNARFRNHTLAFFERHGIKSIGFWTSEIGDYSNNLYYLLAFQDAGQREAAWASFRADPERQRVFAETEIGGPLVERATNTLLSPTDYSPLQ